MNFTRESIFVGAIRSFCSSLAVILGLAVGIGIIGIGLTFLSTPQYVPPKAQPMIMPDAQGDRTVLSGDSPALLRLDFHGVIGMGDLTSDKVTSLLLDSREDFLHGDRIKGILLHLDTPGGATTDSDDIYRTLMEYKTKYKVPIYAYVEGLCASGGMYIASAADKIYATPSSVIGSVGVIMGPAFNFSDAMSKYGVAALTLTEGKDKDELNPFRPWKPNEAASLQDIMASLYDRFVSIVAAARPMLTQEKLVNDYGAHVFISQKAAELGYIDFGNSNYADALTGLATAAQIEGNQKYQVVRLSVQHTLADLFSQSISPQRILQALGVTSPAQHPELSGKILYLYQP